MFVDPEDSGQEKIDLYYITDNDSGKTGSF